MIRFNSRRKVIQIQRMGRKRENWNCSICLDKAEKDSEWISLSCPCEENQYHRNCITKWLLEKTYCPLCRTDVTYPLPSDSTSKDQGKLFSNSIMYNIYVEMIYSITICYLENYMWNFSFRGEFVVEEL